MPKSTWPGESMRLNMIWGAGAGGGGGGGDDDEVAELCAEGWNSNDTALLFIVMQRSCSSGRLSMYRTFPALFLLMIPLLAIKQSQTLRQRREDNSLG